MTVYFEQGRIGTSKMDN